MLGMLPMKFGTRQTETNTDTFQNEALREPESDKWSKGWAILIISTEGYSVLMCLFGFIFSVL